MITISEDRGTNCLGLLPMDPFRKWITLFVFSWRLHYFPGDGERTSGVSFRIIDSENAVFSSGWDLLPMNFLWTQFPLLLSSWQLLNISKDGEQGAGASFRLIDLEMVSSFVVSWRLLNFPADGERSDEVSSE